MPDRSAGGDEERQFCAVRGRRLLGPEMSWNSVAVSVRTVNSACAAISPSGGSCSPLKLDPVVDRVGSDPSPVPVLVNLPNLHAGLIHFLIEPNRLLGYLVMPMAGEVAEHGVTLVVWRVRTAPRRAYRLCP